MTERSSTSSLFPSMTERSSSLFPSVATSSESGTVTPSTSSSNVGSVSATATSWLQNSSFPGHLVQQLNSSTQPPAGKAGLSVKHSSSSADTKDSKRSRTDKVSSDKKKKKKKHKKHKSEKVEEVVTKFDLYDLFYKGDKDNYRYGSLYSYDVPSYKIRIKCCLGDETNCYKQPAPEKPRPYTHDSSSRYYKKISSAELTLQHRTRFLRVNADYISLTVSSQCWEPAEPVLAVLDPSKTDPRNVESWIQFIQSTGTTKAGLERRYDICQKARKFLPQNVLILKKTVETAKQFMSNQQIGRVWTDILFHHPNKLELWLEYLEYKATNLTELNFSSVVAAYRKCLSTLLGFQQGTFRSHVFEGDVEIALIQVAVQFIKLLYNMGYTEKARAYCSSLLELSTSNRNKRDYMVWYEKEYSLLGTAGYIDWWKSQVPSTVSETITPIPDAVVEDIWSVWLQEEQKKERLSSSPTSRRLTEEVIDPECCVTSAWLQQFLFTSTKPDLLFESLFRAHLPENLAKLPLLALFHCQIKLSDNNLEFLMRLCEQLYSRLKDQTAVGVIWTLLTNLRTSNAKTTARFVKGLLKDPSHRNNLTYWSLFTHYSSDSHVVLEKLLSTPLSSYHNTVLRNKLALCQSSDKNKLATCQSSGDSCSVAGEDVGVVDRKIEELICKPIASTTETLHLGSHPAALWCRSYTLKTLSSSSSSSSSSDTLIAEYVSRVLSSDMTRDQALVDLLVMFLHVVQTELRRADLGNTTSAVLKKVTVLAVEQFPQIELFWDVLKKHLTLTNKIWERLLKSGEEAMWYRRVRYEVEKQECNPDINLTNRIISLALNSIDTNPRSILLWQLYIHITQMYDTKSSKSVLIRAIKENPSLKQFYLQAIQICPEEAETVYELIEEKQIRVRTLIEEIQMFSQ